MIAVCLALSNLIGQCNQEVVSVAVSDKRWSGIAVEINWEHQIESRLVKAHWRDLKKSGHIITLSYVPSHNNKAPLPPQYTLYQYIKNDTNVFMFTRNF